MESRASVAAVMARMNAGTGANVPHTGSYRLEGGQATVSGSTVHAALNAHVRALQAVADYVAGLCGAVKQVEQRFGTAEMGLVTFLLALEIKTIALSKPPATSGSQISNGPIETREDFYARCDERARNAIDKDVARLYEKYKDQITIGSETTKGAYYSPSTKSIYFSWEDDATNVRGVCATYFHETGHLVDDFTSKKGDSSSSKKFSQALQNDFDNYVSKVMRDNSCDRETAYEIISDWLYEDADNKNGISDLCGGLTDNECIGKWGHANSYWSGKKEHGIPDKVNNEAFAHFFEASMSTDPTKLNYIKEVFPNAYDEFKSIVNDNI